MRGALAELERLCAIDAPRPKVGLDLGDIAVATTLLGIEFAVASGLSPDVAAFQWRGVYPALTRTIATLEFRPSFTATVPQMMDVNLQATVA